MCIEDDIIQYEIDRDDRDPFCQCGSCAIFGLMLAEDEPEDARTCGYCKAKERIAKLQARVKFLESILEAGGENQ